MKQVEGDDELWLVADAPVPTQPEVNWSPATEPGPELRHSSSAEAGPTASRGARARGSFGQVIVREIQASDLYEFSPLAEGVTRCRFVRLCTIGGGGTGEIQEK
jgi:hypothetical protein